MSISAEAPRWFKIESGKALASAISDDGYYFSCPENRLIVETPSGAVLIQAPPEQRDILQQKLHPLPLTPDEGEYARTLPVARDPLTAFRPFSSSSSSIPLIKRHVRQLLTKKLPSRSHPVFDRPPDIEGPLADLPPLTQDTDALARADPGFSLTEPVPHSDLLVETSLNLREFSLAHFEACEQCENHGGARARQLDPDPSTFSTNIFTCFDSSCYAQHLYRGLWFGYDPALASSITPFSYDNYQSIYDETHRQSLTAAWQKQLRVPCLFGAGDPNYVHLSHLRPVSSTSGNRNSPGNPSRRASVPDASRGINGHLEPWRVQIRGFSLHPLSR